MVMRTQPTLSSGMSARIAEATALSLSSFYTEGESSELDSEKEGSEDESSDSDDERERHGLDDEGHGLDDEGRGLADEGPGIEEEEPTPEGQQQAISVVDTAASETLGLGYEAARRRALESTEDIEPSTHELG
ncbi:hypothetical protein Tco_0147921 [Tanacetum coccineum]